MVAGQVGIADHVRIEAARFSARSAACRPGKVIRGPGMLFWGTPARPIRDVLRELAALARLAKKRA